MPDGGPQSADDDVVQASEPPRAAPPPDTIMRGEGGRVGIRSGARAARGRGEPGLSIIITAAVADTCARAAEAAREGGRRGGTGSASGVRARSACRHVDRGGCSSGGGGGAWTHLQNHLAGAATPIAPPVPSAPLASLVPPLLSREILLF